MVGVEVKSEGNSKQGAAGRVQLSYVEKCRLAFREVKKVKTEAGVLGKGITYDSLTKEGTLE